MLRALVDEQRLVTPEALEGISEEMHARGGLEHLFPYPKHFVEALKLEILLHPTATCGQGSLIAGVIVVCPSGNDRTLGLRIFHELAHAELEHLSEKVKGFWYSHGDVWLLALMLAVPRRALRSSARDLRANAWVPGWAVDLRLTVNRATTRGQ